MPDEIVTEASVNRVKWYVIAILTICVLSVSFVLGITALRPNEDNMQLITVVIGVLTPVIAVLMTGIIKENHDAMDGRLTQLLALTAKSSHAEGKLDEKAESTT